MQVYPSRSQRQWSVKERSSFWQRWGVVLFSSRLQLCTDRATQSRMPDTTLPITLNALPLAAKAISVSLSLMYHSPCVFVREDTVALTYQTPVTFSALPHKAPSYGRKTTRRGRHVCQRETHESDRLHCRLRRQTMTGSVAYRMHKVHNTKKESCHQSYQSWQMTNGGTFKLYINVRVQKVNTQSCQHSK